MSRVRGTYIRLAVVVLTRRVRRTIVRTCVHAINVAGVALVCWAIVVALGFVFAPLFAPLVF